MIGLLARGSAPRHEGWLTPAGISAIAAGLTCLIAVVALLVGGSGDDEPEAAADAQTETRLFVYGTSMPGHLRYPAIEPYVASTAPARVTGRLYDSGAGYPAAKFDEPGQIEGWLLTFDKAHGDAVLREMTQQEAGLFQPTKVKTLGGLEATAYEWIDSTNKLTPIPDGRWTGAEK